ncbi:MULTISPECIES: RNA-binding S4 domain-containing protein [unclassified Mycoplasma]|uniref:RNA-binding S4 domain-containing protein n=1 Tax=unclassified Mycoplasma TaxID=2683645 RepID=UPI00211BB87F|nr:MULTISPECIES: RNA-binding S4 domain-containing protein [unclassified Mycoplasma]UUM19816.1 RNA-binding S4 domain-containing protein [Mycoplasma sp. 1578d]UUM24800.1 RNA-binding S4 domain-containing protein [Mycoplasma sp. 3686d]
MIVKIKGDSIKLSQFLKKIHETQTGGQAKYFVKNNSIKINGETPQGRSSKIKPGDIVWVNDTLIKVVAEEE